MARLFQIAAHCSIILDLCVVTFEVLDWFNPYMNFLGLPISTGLLLAFCLLAVLQALRTLYCEERLASLRQELGELRKVRPRGKGSKSLKKSARHPEPLSAQAGEPPRRRSAISRTPGKSSQPNLSEKQPPERAAVFFGPAPREVSSVQPLGFLGKQKSGTLKTVPPAALILMEAGPKPRHREKTRCPPAAGLGRPERPPRSRTPSLSARRASQ